MGNWPKASGAGYASLVQSGVSALAAMTVTPDTSAVYARAYQQVMQRKNAEAVQHQGELSAAAAKQRGVRERTQIGLVQDIAEASIRANAAAAGVKGGNVASGIYQTGANAAWSVSEQGIREENEIEQAMAQVYSGAQAKMVPTDDYNSSLMGGIMAGIGSVDSMFFKDLGLAIESTPQSTNSVPTDKLQIDPTPYDSGSGEMLA